MGINTENTGKVPGQEPEFNRAGGVPQDPGEAVQELLQSLGVNFNLSQSQGQSATLSPEEILEQAENIIETDSEFQEAFNNFFNIPNIGTTRDQTLQNIAQILESRGLEPTPENVREAFLTYASAVQNASNAQVANNIRGVIDNFTQTFSVNIQSNVPTINPPDVPAGTNPADLAEIALDNEWFRPNPTAIFFQVILEVAHVQAQIRFANGIEQSELVLQGLQVAQERAEVIIRRGELQAAQEIAQAIVNLATAAAAIAIAAYTIQNTVAGARNSVRQKLDNAQNNPNYSKQFPNDTPQTQKKLGVERYNNTREGIDELKQQRAKETDATKIQKLDKQIEQQEKIAKELKPGTDDIDVYTKENNLQTNELPKNLQETRKAQQGIVDNLSDPGRFEQAVNTKIQNVASITQNIGNAINGLGQSVNGFIRGVYATQIADAESIDALLQEFQQSIGRFYQTTQTGKEEAGQQVRDFVQFLRDFISAHSGVFGFSGGRVV